MDLERQDVSSSESSSGSEAEDQMVRIELEAAEALADLAHLAMRESGSGGSARKWGSKGKRAKKRVKSESPPADPGLCPVVDPVPTCPDLATDRVQVGPEVDGEPACRGAEVNCAKVEVEGEVEIEVESDAGLAKPSLGHARNYPSCGAGRSRLNLSEAEKEERRLRRILANRESARQTIRRRQALCEELTRKAADLTWENGNLKQEKDRALKEFESLEIMNKCLKAQMAKVIKSEVDESQRDLKPACAQMPATATNCPPFLYNQHTFSPLCWPSVVQPSNAVQSHHGPPSAVVVPSNMPIPANSRLDSTQQPQGNPVNVDGSRTSYYIMSCPWFFSAPDNRNGFHSQSSFCLQEGTSVYCPQENGFVSLPVKSEVASSTEVRIIDDLNQTPVGFSLDGSDQCTGSQLNETMFTSPPLGSVTSTVAVRNETGSCLGYSSGTNGISMKAGHRMNPLPEKNKDPFKFSSKKLADSAAAAEARRRRKELTKLKNLHGRQFQMNC